MLKLLVYPSGKKNTVETHKPNFSTRLLRSILQFKSILNSNSNIASIKKTRNIFLDIYYNNNPKI